MTCVECGAEMDTARDCGRCGAPVPAFLQDEAPGVPPAARAEGMSIAGTIGLAFLTCTAALEVIVFFVLGITEGSPAQDTNYIPPWDCARIALVSSIVFAVSVVVARRSMRRERELQAVKSDSPGLRSRPLDP